MNAKLAAKTAEIIYQGELRTTCTHKRSGTEILTDAPVDNHGKGEAFSPTDLLSTSLVACMITIMGIQANKRKIKIGKVSGTVEKIMGEAPRRVIALIVELTLRDHSLSKSEKILLENAALNCPVAKSIHPDIQMNTKFNYA